MTQTDPTSAPPAVKLLGLSPEGASQSPGKEEAKQPGTLPGTTPWPMSPVKEIPHVPGRSHDIANLLDRIVGCDPSAAHCVQSDAVLSDGSKDNQQAGPVNTKPSHALCGDTQTEMGLSGQVGDKADMQRPESGCQDGMSKEPGQQALTEDFLQEVYEPETPQVADQPLRCPSLDAAVTEKHLVAVPSSLDTSAECPDMEDLAGSAIMPVSAHPTKVAGSTQSLLPHAKTITVLVSNSRCGFLHLQAQFVKACN